MSKYRIKIEVREAGNLFTPQVYEGFFWGWIGFVSVLCGRYVVFHTRKEAEVFIKEKKSKEITKIKYTNV